jgi:glycosyltransferase involved in cell wall biosynthesis
MQTATITNSTEPAQDLNTWPQYYSMIVFCHLRWDFVFQRPQHLMTRMSGDRRMLFIEEPVQYSPEEENTANLIKVSEHIHVLQPKVRNIDAIREILPDYILNKSIPVGWFYSAAFVSLSDVLQYEAIVYDCMDELTLFKEAPIELINQEKQLIKIADVVFTGGKSLYESKKELHDNVFCFPSSVDEQHFGTAKKELPVPDDIRNISGDIVGYFGVIDERIDLELIAQTADMLTEVSFVMIGPLAKITEADLPRRQNIRYLGMKHYSELPAYLGRFTIAMMPFALNEATKFISPTKTLEYMAAGKPIISTRITDVVTDYSDVVSLVQTPEDFAQAIEEMIILDRDFHETKYNSILANTSWDATANQMKTQLNKIERKCNTQT